MTKHGWRYVTVLVLLCALVIPFLKIAPAAAIGGTLWWSENGNSQATFSANATITIYQGTFEDINFCVEQNGSSDAINVAATVYIVPHTDQPPADGSTLNAVGTPVPIVAQGSGGLFIDETIGYTAPSGKVGAGVYDVVYDECQDGKFDSSEDEWFSSAITVVMPTIPPLPSTAIQTMKQNAAQQAALWKAFHQEAKQLFEDLDAARLEAAGMDPAEEVALEYEATLKKVLHVDVEQGVVNDLKNTYTHYQALADDPPDPNFQQETVLGPHQVYDPQTGDPVLSSLVAVGTSVSSEQSLAQALLDSMQRYQGAQQADASGASTTDHNWALVQALEMQEYSADLANQVIQTNNALTDFGTSLSGDSRNIDGVGAAWETLRQQIVTNGFTDNELLALHSLGLTDSQISDFQAQLAAKSFAFSTSDTLSNLTNLQTSMDQQSQAMIDLANAMTSVINDLNADSLVDLVLPIGDAGGPYTVDQGATLTLDGTNSHEPISGSGAPTITSYAWDLNGDGVFDDATGVTPSVVFNTPYRGSIGLQVTDSDGKTNVSYAQVTVNQTSAPPQIVNPSPSILTLHVSPGDTQAFSIGTNGGTPSITWRLDGADVGSGTSYSYSPATTDTGGHIIQAVVVDSTNPQGFSDSVTWYVEVFSPTVPGTPENLQVSSTSGSVTLSWTAPWNGGSPIDRFDVTLSANSSVVQSQQVTDLTNLTATFTGLTNGTQYSIAVAAHNAIGVGPVASLSQIPTGPPGAPTGVTVSNGDGQATVMWSAPTDTGGGTVDAYDVTVTGSGYSTSQHISDLSNLSATFTGLVNGGEYSVAITAHNAAGSGPAATATLAPYGVPGAPQNVVVTPEDGQLDVVWDPASSNGSPIDHYDVTLSGGASPVQLQITDLSQLTASFAGLTNGTTYSITLTAHNGAGDGMPATATGTPQPTPAGASFSIEPTKGHNVALYDGTGSGSQVIGFSSEWNTYHSPQAMLDAAVSSSDTPWATGNGQLDNQYVIFVLAGGNSYQIDHIQVMPRPTYQNQSVKDFAVDVSNTTSDDSAFTTVLTGTVVNNGKLQTFVLAHAVMAKYLRYRPLTNYGSPCCISTQQLTVLTTVAGGDTVALTDQSNPGSAGIASWSWDFGDGTSSTEENPTHTYAQPGTYSITLTVTDNAGNVSHLSKTYTAYAVDFPPPSSPTNLQGTPGSRSVSITWQAPADTSGLSVDAYQVSIPAINYHATVQLPHALSWTINNLNDGHSYTVNVAARTAAGYGTSASITLIPVDPPNEPGGISVKPGDGTLSFSWGVPYANGGTIDHYTATLSANGTTVRTQEVTSPTADFSGLTNGTTYSVSVTAHNEYGDSPARTATGIPSAVPDAPTNLSVIEGDRQLDVLWTAAHSFSPVTKYHVHVTGPSGYSRAFDLTSPCDGTDCAAGVADLINGEQYTFTVTAINATGTGPSSSVSGVPAPLVTNLTPATSFYITERWDRGLAKVTYDPATNKHTTDNGFLKGLPSAGPDSLIFDHHGDMVVSNTDAGYLSLVDPNTGSVLTPQINATRIPGVADVALDPSSDTIAAINWSGSGLYLVDLTSGATTLINPDRSHVNNFGGVVYNGDGTRLFVSSHNGWIYEVDPQTGAMIRKVYAGGSPDGMTYDPTTGHIFASACNGGIGEFYIGTDATPTLVLLKIYHSIDGDGIAADGQGHVFVISGWLYRLDLTTDTRTVIASESDGWDDVAPVVGAGSANTPPVASDQTVSTKQGSDLPITLSATDAEHDTLTYQVVDGPNHGTLTGTAPDLTYAPDPAFSGADQFTFTANDGQVDSNVATVSVTVVPVNHPPVLAQLSDQAVDFNDKLAFEISATDPDGNTVALTVDGLPDGLTFTDHGDGTGQVSGTVASDPGDYPVTFTADDGQSVNNTGTMTMTITVTKEQSSISYTGPANQDYHDAVTVSATLVDPNDDTPISGKTLTFTLNGAETCSADTDSNGTVGCDITPIEPAGSYPLVVSFAGNTDYVSASASANFTVNLEETTLSISSSNVQATGQVAVTATLLEDGASAIANRTVNFTATPSDGGVSVTGSGTTDANGNVSVQLDLSPGDFRLDARFVGDSYYLAADAETQSHLYVYQPTQFVIWGGNPPGTASTPNVAVGSDYMFWGAQWAKQVTGGDYAGTNSFKGYAGAVSGDGASWTRSASPGNSGRPPSSVASYIGVLVSTSITKTGKTITGNVAEIVVIKVDDRSKYAPNPGHAGTGVMVARIS